MNYLKLIYIEDGSTLGELSAQVHANGFSGFGSAFISKETLLQNSNEFGKYPLSNNTPPVIEGGYLTQPKQTNLRIFAYPLDSVGLIGLSIYLSTFINPDDQIESQHSVTVNLQTNYEELKRFSDNLKKLAEGTITEMALEDHNVKQLF
jgi:hypothetical protein